MGGERVFVTGAPLGYDAGKPEQVKTLLTLGVSEAKLPQALETDKRTFEAWKLKHPEFAEAIEEGKDVATKRVEAALFEKAIGAHVPATKIMKTSTDEVLEVPYIEHYPPDVEAAKFWLKNRDPEHWKDVSQQEIINPGNIIPVINISLHKPVESLPQNSKPDIVLNSPVDKDE